MAVTTRFPRTPVEAGANWANAYFQYAKMAHSPLGGTAIPAQVEAARELLARQLMLAFATPVPDKSITASAMATALTSFWFAPPMVFAGTPPGVVTAVLGTVELRNGLVLVWTQSLAEHASADLVSNRIGQLFEAFTHTVIVTHPGAPPIVGPLS